MIVNCEYRHENGNCLFVGGFCTSVTKEHCVKEHDKRTYNKALEDVIKVTRSLEFRQGCIQSKMAFYDYVELELQKLRQ